MKRKQPGTSSAVTVRSTYDLFELVRDRPGMYLGTKSIERLVAFEQGFSYARVLVHQPFVDNPPFGHFFDFVAARFRDSATKGWCRIILENTEADVVKSVDRFYELLDAFRTLKYHTLYQHRLSAQQQATFRRSLPHRHPATSIRIGHYKVPRMPIYVDFIENRRLVHQTHLDTLQVTRKWIRLLKQNSMPIFSVKNLRD